MEIRFICQNELQWAVYTANEVFGRSVRPHVQSEEEIRQYHSYVCVENLWQEMRAGRLLLWGAYENGRMCAVSAMQNTGHITMLYVLPEYGGRHIAMRLLNEMGGYAEAVLRRERVTVHVTPVSAASFFYHAGFTTIQGAPLGNGYLPLERQIWVMPQRGCGGVLNGKPVYPGADCGGALNGKPVYPGVDCGNAPQKQQRPEVTYPPKKVSARAVLLLIMTVLVLSLAIVIGTTVHHITADGLKTEEDYWDENLIERMPEEFGVPEEV